MRTERGAEARDSRGQEDAARRKEGWAIKKTPHQLFIDELHRQLTPGAAHRADVPEESSGEADRDSRKEDIMRELERRFKDLFGNPDNKD